MVNSDLPAGFRVKIPDVEIEFHSPDTAEVHKRFDEILTYMKELTGESKTIDLKKRK